MGCLVYPGAIPDRLEDGIRGPGFPVEVYNMLGAGDAFMAGFLRGWLRGEPIATTCAWANACGAIAVSRLLCSPEYPTFDELQAFLGRAADAARLAQGRGAQPRPLGETRRPQPDTLMALAIDHRSQLEAMADRLGAPRERIGRFKELAVEAAARVADGEPGFGMLIDGTYGAKALFTPPPGIPSGSAGRSSSRARARCDFEGGGDLGAHLIEWPVIQTVKCLCFYHPDDPDELKARQERELTRALRRGAHRRPRTADRDHRRQEWPARRRTRSPRVLERLYALGIRPDWWKLEPQATAAAWDAIDRVIAATRSLVPRRRPARSRCAGGRSGARLCRCRRQPAGERFRRRPHDLRRGGRAPGSPAASTMRRQSPTWRPASRVWSTAWQRRGRRGTRRLRRWEET